MNNENKTHALNFVLLVSRRKNNIQGTNCLREDTWEDIQDSFMNLKCTPDYAILAYAKVILHIVGLY